MERSTRQVLVRDGLLAILLALLGAAGTAGAGLEPGAAVPVDGWAYALMVLAALALVVRRWRPVLTLAVTTLAASAYLVLGYPYGPILVVFFVAVYSVARHVATRQAALAAALALLVLLLHAFVGLGERPGWVGLVPAAAWVVVPFAVGVTIRLTQESAARQRAEQLRRHADEERLRMAQEVHDVVGHGLAAINMQAQIALHLLTKRPEQAQVALSAISKASEDALAEMRATLAVVRSAEAADRAVPAAGLARLDDLVSRVRDSGVPVHVDVSGEPVELPVAVDLTAYRVAQESLTNVLRHAGAASATVRLEYRPRELVVEVTDAGGGAAPAGDVARQDLARHDLAGQGIAGMRERVSALDGEFAAGPRPEGGFRVYACLPVERSS